MGLLIDMNLRSLKDRVVFTQCVYSSSDQKILRTQSFPLYVSHYLIHTLTLDDAKMNYVPR